MWNLIGEIYDTCGEQVDNIWVRLEYGWLSATAKNCGWTKDGIWKNELGGGMNRSLRIYLRREDCGSCGIVARDLDAKMPTCLLHNAQHAYYTAKINAKKDKFASVKDNKENNFCVTKNA